MFVASLASLGIRLAGLASTFLLGVVLARALGPTQYGLYGLVISLSAIAMNVALLGTPQLAVREIAARSAAGDWPGCRGLSNRFLGAAAASTLILGVIALAGAYAVAGSNWPIISATLLGLVITLAVGIGALAAAALRGLGRIEKGQFMEIVGRPVGALVVLALAVAAGLRVSAAAALAIQAAVATIGAIVTLRWLRRAMPVGPSARVGWSWLKAALPLGLVDVLRQIDGTYGVILVGAFASARDLGLYRVAVSSSVLAAMPVTILHVVLAPTVSRHYRFGEIDSLQRLLRLSSAIMCASIAPMLAILLLFGRPLVSFVFGAIYGDAWVALALLCAAQLLLGLFGLAPVLLAMADSEAHLAKVYAVALAVGALSAVILVPSFGLSGAAAAQLISTGMVALLSARFAKRRLSLGTTFLGATLAPRDQANEDVRS